MRVCLTTFVIIQGVDIDAYTPGAASAAAPAPAPAPAKADAPSSGGGGKAALFGELGKGDYPSPIPASSSVQC